MLFTTFIVRTPKILFVAVATGNYIIPPQRLLLKVAATVLQIAARNCSLAFKTLFAHYSLLHDVYLENKMEGIKMDLVI